MNKSRKIAAFTMVDILTGMVISSIIISMVFYLFTALNKQVADYGNTRNEINSFLLLRTDLARQFDGMDNDIIGIPEGIELNRENVRITYKKQGDFFIRKFEENVDTLSDHLAEMTVEFIPTKTGELSNSVKELNLKVNFDRQVLTAHFYRTSSLVDEINESLIHVF